MTALLVRPAPAGPAIRNAAAGFLRRYLRTLAVLGAAATALVVVCSLAAPATWPVAVAVGAGWSGAAGAWLLRTGSLGRTAVHLCTWIAPAALLVPLAAPGWLTPGGLALWWPLSTLLAVALALTHRP